VGVGRAALGRLAMSFWAGKRVLLTGHTGFKGAWLALRLVQEGAEVHGLALAPEPGSLFERARIGELVRSSEVDVRDREAVARAAGSPDVVLHLAAEAIVRRSLRDPVTTYAVNVLGTAHVLEAVPDARAVVVVTSDKCYENREWAWGYREGEPLGGEDPYSSSKAAQELVAGAFRASYGRPIATARAGNVIGGGDHAEDRLVPDLVRAVAAGEPLRVRNPHAVRPWQHVLCPLDGYLVLAERLWEDPSVAGPWNFGPADEDAREVAWIADRICERWGEGASWEADGGEHPREAGLLKLDASRARAALGWAPRFGLDRAIDLVVDWHRAVGAGEDPREVTLRQLATA
jgi:CDP-glucose 4,6-dehydratase